MSRTIPAEPLTADAFAAFGDVLEARGVPDRLINEGLCGRYHDRARLDFGTGRAGLSVFDAVPRALPYDFTLVERHPEGSLARDEGGWPGRPRAFLTDGSQGINLLRGTWHGVLTPLHAPGLFAVVDRIGEGANLEEYRYDAPWRVVRTGAA